MEPSGTDEVMDVDLMLALELPADPLDDAELMLDKVDRVDTGDMVLVRLHPPLKELSPLSLLLCA